MLQKLTPFTETAPWLKLYMRGTSIEQFATAAALTPMISAPKITGGEILWAEQNEHEIVRFAMISDLISSHLHNLRKTRKLSRRCLGTTCQA